MNIKELTQNRFNDFADYCKKHRREVDDSFLYDEDLEKFIIGEDNPTYIITDEEDRIIATASLILDEYNRSGKKGRFRIFHSEINDREIYQSLLRSILSNIHGIEKVYVFVSAYNETLTKSIAELDFQVERHIFLMIRDLDNVPEYSLPSDYTIRPLELNRDEETWCLVRNAAFATVKGNETPVVPAQVKEMILGIDNIEGGCMILYHKDKAVGCIRCSLDDHENEPVVNIGALAVIPEYQGKGLGRLLLRAGMQFAKDKSFSKTILCVNTENEKAKSLYLHEGFKEVEGIVCYYYKCS